jgi:predicted transcriptional regulator
MAISDDIEVTAEIVAAFVSFNSIPMSELPNLISSVHEGISGIAGHINVATPDSNRPDPAVSIRKSVTPDYLICLDDGKRYKSLRRHLALLGMTPEQYRAKWQLPRTYPMVAANYAAKRSEMAKSYGFGRKRERPDAEPAGAIAKRKPGRPRKLAQ